MSGRKRFVLDKAWLSLQECNETEGRMVTAGEFAKATGITRNTAHNWLIEMWGEGAINATSRRRGNVTVYRFGVYGFDYNGKA